MEEMKHPAEPNEPTEPNAAIEPSPPTATEAKVSRSVALIEVMMNELLRVTGDSRFLIGELIRVNGQVQLLRSSGITRRDAAAALWSCRYARERLEGAAAIGALDEVIEKLALIEIAGPP